MDDRHFPVRKTKGKNNTGSFVSGWMADPLPMGDYRSGQRKSGQRFQAWYQVLTCDDKVYDDRRISVELENVSPSGACMISKALLQPGSRVRLFVRDFSGSGPEASVIGRVTRCRNESSSWGSKAFNVGLEFKEICLSR